MRLQAFAFASFLLGACGGSTTDDAGVDATRTDLGVTDGAVADLVSDAPCTTDADGDGHRSIACGGDDCDDGDPNRYPGNHEVCDGTNHDEDCDPSTFGFRDSDGDGYGDAHCCNVAAAGTLTCGTDCDDANGNVHPMQPEVCNGVDDNCNGMIDEGAPGASFWPDCDGDGFGAMTATPTTACTAPPAPPTCATPSGTPGWAMNATDCNDGIAMVHPGAAGTCSCATDAGDADHDGHVTTACGGGDCNDADATIYDGAPELCDALDNDCNGVVDYPTAAPCVTCVTTDGSRARHGCSGSTDVCCIHDSDNRVECLSTSDAATFCPATATNVEPYACDGPEDCATGLLCCVTNGIGGGFGSPGSSVCAATCAYRAACHVTADCPAGQTCGPYTSVGGYPTGTCA